MEEYSHILQDIDLYNATLVAVSKTKSIEQILQIYNLGQRIFGENRVRELVEKGQLLPDDVEWHMIGHLQKNKAKQIVPFVSLIHSVESLSLLKILNKEAVKVDRTLDILLQYKIGKEETKYGIELNDDSIIVDYALSLSNIRVRGLMGMASFVEDELQIRSEFRSLKNKYDNFIDSETFGDSFNILSMGMSGDYKIALDEGANMVRIGSLIFGSRGLH